jgi:peroxiredoxin
MEKLQAGDIFPKFEVETVAHGRLKLPEDLKGRYAVVLYYRGWW